MSRPITLFTGQWADIPFEELAKKVSQWGYDGLEVACWGDHLDVFKAADDLEYCKKKLEILKKYGLCCYAVGSHLLGQLVCDPNNDRRTDAFVPSHFSGNAEKKRQWAIESMKKTAKAAYNLGVDIVTGFCGSPIWHLFYRFPPVDEDQIAQGFKYFAKMWVPILDIFAEYNVKFALEVHPTEIAYDIITAKKALEAIDYHPAFGFNFDPSHLYWQMINPVFFIREFPEHIFHCHMKDAVLQVDGCSSILASHLNFGDPRRGWDFRSLGHGGVNFEEIIRSLNYINYDGPLSVEWEDCGMEREYGAQESLKFVRKLNFVQSAFQFDKQFDL